MYLWMTSDMSPAPCSCYSFVFQAVLDGDAGESTRSNCELVKCKLTLSYEYWQMHEVVALEFPLAFFSDHYCCGFFCLISYKIR